MVGFPQVVGKPLRWAGKFPKRKCHETIIIRHIYAKQMMLQVCVHRDQIFAPLHIYSMEDLQP